MKILITGANGQLGSELTALLAGSHNIYPFDLDLDVTDYSKVTSKVREIKPDCVIHSAAMTDVDGCEGRPDDAWRVNAIATQNVALACRKTGSSLVYVSTDFVFDGAAGEPYTEFDRPDPLSVYGKSKLAGEQFVRGILPEHFIVRTAWLYGRNGNNFVKTIVRLSEEKDEIRVVNDQVGSPTFAYDLAEKICEIITHEWYGTYHVTNQGSVSWYDFAKEIIRRAGRKDVRIIPISTAELNRPASRPAYSVLRNYVLELRGIAPMRPYEKALEDFFS